jgi:peptidoglycan/xylan/chitin deacetylase (PgdA/CDA1 family)
VIARHAKLFLKQFVSPVLDGLGLYDRHLRHLPVNRWTIVMYHRIIQSPESDPFSLGMCVTQEHLDAQLRYFKRYFTPIGMSEATRLVEQGLPLPPRALSVTFDDGYLDNQTLALPLLKTYQIPAALFVPTGGLENDEPLWWDRVIYALDATDKHELSPGALGIPLPHQSLSLDRWQRDETVARILDSLWTLPITQVLEVVKRIELALPPARRVSPVARRMNPQQITQMHQAGIEIGAHSVSHPNLTLETPASVRQEMQISKKTLENIISAPINGFAYPAGWKNADAVAAVQESGFSYAVATVRGVNQIRTGCHLFELLRVGMPDTSVSDFKRALSDTMQQATRAAKVQG